MILYACMLAILRTLCSVGKALAFSAINLKVRQYEQNYQKNDWISFWWL